MEIYDLSDVSIDDIVSIARTLNVYQPNAQNEGLVAINKQKILGFIAWQKVLDEAEILSIAVIAPEQSKGIGKLLFNEMIERLSKRGVCQFFLEVKANNHRAIQLYHSFQFKAFNRRKHYYREKEDYIDAILMKKSM